MLNIGKGSPTSATNLASALKPALTCAYQNGHSGRSPIPQVFLAAGERLQSCFQLCVLDQGIPKGGNYIRSTTALVLWTLRVDTRSKGGVGCVYVVWERGSCAGACKVAWRRHVHFHRPLRARQTSPARPRRDAVLPTGAGRARRAGRVSELRQLLGTAQPSDGGER
jgi:hypothetical protein